jgi:nucleoid-associated protein YgaU
MKKYLLILIVLASASLISLGAQGLLDNPDYQKSLELSAQAKEAFDGGDYDSAEDLANQAKEYALRSDEYVAKMIAKAAADKAMGQAKDKIAWADGVGAKDKYPDLYEQATDRYDEAEAAYGDEDYKAAEERARESLAALEGIADAIAKAGKAAPPAKAASSDGTWPAVYVVRLIPARRDCLWRIAEYPFIYNNPLKWTVIYEANKKTFRDPGNPNLIFPGQKLQIPAIKGEAREGTYDPAKSYKNFPKK